MSIFFSINILAQTPESTIKLLSPNGAEYWTNGSFPRITWKSTNLTIVKIEISINAGASWDILTPATVAINGFYSGWKVNNVESDQCLIRVSKFDNPDLFDVSESFFRITSDTTSHTLVVLGSSTAVGTGTSSKDSSWVTRYTNYIYEKNTTVKIINLAIGGFTTYDIMPNSFIPLDLRPEPKIGNNITKALTYNPKAIIINLPSNDVNMGFSIREQLANYDTILTLANLGNIPVWVSTTQPRNFENDKIQLQLAMRDSTYSRFGEKTIDFWTGIADSNGRIIPSFNSGDGIHLNDKGHAILFSRVLDKQIFDQVLVSIKDSKELNTGIELMQNYPNPFNPTTKIKYSIPFSEKFNQSVVNISLKVYDVLGREIRTLVNEKQSPGNYEVIFNGSNLASGVYFYRIETVKFGQTKKLMLVK